MSDIYQVVSLGFVCYFLTILFVPLSIKIAPLLGAMDNPAIKKIHSKPIPRLGGMAIFLSIFIIFLLFPSIVSQLHNRTKLLIGISVLSIFLLGVLDDIKDLTPKIKLFFQILIIFLAVLGLFITYNPINFIYFIIIFLFILIYTNAFNLIDGMDGLASGVATFTALSLLTISLLSNQQFAIWSACLILSASLGFIIFNHNPAKVFLGDCGSTFLGFSLSLIVTIIWLNSSNKFVLLPLLVITGIPIFDTLFAVSRRLKYNSSILEGDRNHFYDFIMQKGFSVKQTVIIIYSITLLISLSGIVLFIFIEF